MALLPTEPKRQKQLVIGLLPLLALLGYWYFFHGTITEEIGQMEDRLARLEGSNEAARAIAAQGGPELERRLELYRSHITRLERLIPTSEEVPELLDAISIEGQTAGVDVALIRPEGQQVGPYYTRQLYQYSVLGAYHDIGRFLTAIGSLPRIITTSNLVVRPPQGSSSEPGESPQLQADLRIETYVLPPPAVEEDGNA